MNTISKLIGKFAIVSVAFILTSTASFAALTASDNAANAAYSGGWANGSNGGTGFGAWSLTQTTAGSGAAGQFIGNSTSVGGPGADINTSSKAFGMFGHDGAPNNGTSTSTRLFSGDLSVGQTFSIDIAVNFRNGQKGFDLLNSGSATIFNLNIGNPGSGDDYVVNNATTGGGSLGNTYNQNTAFHISLTQTTLSGGTWTVNRTGGVTSNASGTYTGVGAGFKLYEDQTSSNANENNLFANNMSVVPEPSTVSLLLGSSAFAGFFLLRRKRA